MLQNYTPYSLVELKKGSNRISSMYKEADNTAYQMGFPPPPRHIIHNACNFSISKQDSSGASELSHACIILQ